MNWQSFQKAAMDAGFSRAYCVSAEPFTHWAEVAKADPDPRWAKLSAAPQNCMPGAKCVLALVWAYTPFLPPAPGEPSIDAYYPASQAAHSAAARLAALLRDSGYRADSSPALPAKNALLRSGEARYGKNGLLAVDGFGTRVCIQLILTDAPFPAVDHSPEREIDPRCDGCGACMRVCPANALNGDSRVSVSRCLRALPYAESAPVDKRRLLGRSLLGCDICQSICPRNAGVSPAPMPEALAAALSLPRLLAGDVKPLAGFIGTNYARPMRIISRAAILAANLGRVDCAPALRALSESEFPHIRDHALWALRELSCV